MRLAQSTLAALAVLAPFKSATSFDFQPEIAMEPVTLTVDEPLVSEIVTMVAPADTECPAEPFSTDPCNHDLTCEYGRECCCDECHPSIVGGCYGGEYSWYNTDACYMPWCQDQQQVVAIEPLPVAVVATICECPGNEFRPDDGKLYHVVEGIGSQDECPTDPALIPEDECPPVVVETMVVVAAPLGDAQCPLDDGLTPLPESGGACSHNDECRYGRETCCGQTHDSYACHCFGGKYECMSTDACMHAPSLCPKYFEVDCECPFPDPGTGETVSYVLTYVDAPYGVCPDSLPEGEGSHCPPGPALTPTEPEPVTPAVMTDCDCDDDGTVDVQTNTGDCAIACEGFESVTAGPAVDEEGSEERGPKKTGGKAGRTKPEKAPRTKPEKAPRTKAKENVDVTLEEWLRHVPCSTAPPGSAYDICDEYCGEDDCPAVLAASTRRGRRIRRRRARKLNDAAERCRLLEEEYSSVTGIVLDCSVV